MSALEQAFQNVPRLLAFARHDSNTKLSFQSVFQSFEMTK